MNTITQINNAQYLYGTRNFSKAKQNNCEQTNIQTQLSFKAKCSAKPFKSWVEYIKSLWEGFPATTQIIENKNLKKAMKIDPDKTHELYRDNIGYIRGTYTPTMILHIVKANLVNSKSASGLEEYLRRTANGYIKPDAVDELVTQFKKNSSAL